MKPCKDPVDEIRQIRDKISLQVKDFSYKELLTRYNNITSQLSKDHKINLSVRTRSKNRK